MTQPNIVLWWKSLSPQLQSVLRIVAAFIFMQSGAMKLFAFPIAPKSGHPVELVSEAGLGGVLELFGGLLILIGLFTRPVAFILSGQMAVAYFQFHAPNGFWTVENGGGNAMLFCFVWLFFSAAGAGPWSIDAVRKKTKT